MLHRLLILACALLLPACASAAERDWEGERGGMIRAVESLAAVAGVREARRIDPAVIAAMRAVPRHLLVPEPVRRHAYENRPLPIGYEATISQPYIVALMTHLLRVEPGMRVLEVGTGSGYQAAILSEMGAQVWSIEIVEALARRAARDLAAIGHGGVIVIAGDGYAGWPDAAPFDRIVVTAAAPRIPQPLIDQLRPGGRMVIPVGRSHASELMLVEKDESGQVRRRALLPVAFVPLQRGAQ